MAECEWAILCEHPFKDAQHRLGMIGIFDTLAFDVLPQPLQHGWLNIKFRGQPGERVTFTVRIFQPGGQVTDTPQPPTLVINETGSTEMSLDLLDLQIEQFGSYEFEIQVTGQASLVTTLLIVRAH